MGSTQNLLMEISALNSFIAVAKHQSFSNAAQQLRITQPALSKRVAALEKELGIKLFHRASRRVSLTEAGSQLLSRAQDLISQAEDMQRFAANLNSDISGKLSIAIAHHIGLHRMPPILRAFNSQFPQVALDIHFEDSDQAFHMVEHGEIEFAIITLPSKLPDGLRKERVWPDPLKLVVGPEHVLANQKKIAATELFNFPCVLPEKITETHQIMLRAAEKVGSTLMVQMETNNLESLKMLVTAGIGWSALPDTIVDKTTTVIDCDLQLERELGMVFHSKRSLSNAAEALVALIRELN